MESDCPAVSSQHIATESEVGMEKRNRPSVNIHPCHAFVPVSVPSSPTQCGKTPSSHLSILPSPLPLYWNLTVSPSFLSSALGFLHTVNDTEGIYALAWCSVSKALSALGESLCCIAALCPLRLLACILAMRLSLQVKGGQWFSGRSVSKAGRAQTAPLICLPPGRIT